jgi:16S rRNA G966 N2-methylase RsmD
MSYNNHNTKLISVPSKTRNFVGLKKLIFPKIADSKIPQLMIDKESTKFITFASTAEVMTHMIRDCMEGYPNPPEINEEEWSKMSLDQRCMCLVMTEMTAGVGGNVLSFAYHFKYVNAIEINKLRFDYLNINLKVYGINNVNTYHADSMKLLIDQNELVQDIVFFDPPWGGKEYKLHNVMRLNFMDQPIEAICKKLLGKDRIKIVVIKLPNNYDFTFFDEELKEYKIVKHALDRLTMVIVKSF